MPEASDLRQRALALLAVLGGIWLVSLYALFLDAGLVYDLALLPRRFDGLPGVFGMPFVHGSLGHLMANSGPLLAFGAMLLGRGVGYYLSVTLAVAVLGGLLLWLFGRNAAHIGASGLAFGLFGFLIVRGLYERRATSIAISVAVTVFYGGMVFGVLPSAGDGTQREGQVSWDGHLFGLLAGVALAVALDRWQKRRAAP